MHELKTKISKLLLSRSELIHLRDLMGAKFPSNSEDETISSLLASYEGTTSIEKKLWSKVYKLCKKQEIPVGENAPDYIATLTSMPMMTMVRMQPDDDFIIEEQLSDLLTEEKHEKTNAIECGTSSVSCTKGTTENHTLSSSGGSGEENVERERGDLQSKTRKKRRSKRCARTSG